MYIDIDINRKNEAQIKLNNLTYSGLITSTAVNYVNRLKLNLTYKFICSINSLPKSLIFKFFHSSILSNSCSLLTFSYLRSSIRFYPYQLSDLTRLNEHSPAVPIPEIRSIVKIMKQKSPGRSKITINTLLTYP